MQALSLAMLLGSATAFSPAVCAAPARASAAGSVQMRAEAPVSRRAVAAGAAAAFAGVLPSFAADDKYKLQKDYPKDARNLLSNMVLATDLARGAPNMESIVKSTRSEMNDFVAFYRRQPKVAGMPSFSTLYTAVNTLSGHYASYGNKYPVPEKRKVRDASPARGSPCQHVLSRARPQPLPLRRVFAACAPFAGSPPAAVQGDRACARPWQVSVQLERGSPQGGRTPPGVGALVGGGGAVRRG